MFAVIMINLAEFTKNCSFFVYISIQILRPYRLQMLLFAAL